MANGTEELINQLLLQRAEHPLARAVRGAGQAAVGTAQLVDQIRTKKQEQEAAAQAAQRAQDVQLLKLGLEASKAGQGTIIRNPETGAILSETRSDNFRENFRDFIKAVDPDGTKFPGLSNISGVAPAKEMLGSKPSAPPQTQRILPREIQVPASGLTLGPGQKAVFPPAPPKEATTKKPTSSEVAQRDFGIEMSKNLQIIAEKFNPGLVGILDAKRAKMQQKTGFGATKEAGSFLASASGLQNVILKARSGGAVTPSEASRLLNEIPDPAASEVDFIAKYERFSSIFNELMEGKGLPYRVPPTVGKSTSTQSTSTESSDVRQENIDEGLVLP